MFYRGFFVKIFKKNNIIREDKEQKKVCCNGFYYEVFVDDVGGVLIDRFDAAEGFELPNICSEIEAELFTREMIDMQFKEYCRKRDREVGR